MNGHAQTPHGDLNAVLQAPVHRHVNHLLGNMRLSIRSKIMFALFSVILLMSVPYAFLLVPGLQYKQQYDTIIENVTTANSINGSVKQAIDSEMWSIVAGKTRFSNGHQYLILDDTDRRVQQMYRNTDSLKGKVKLSVIQRTLQTLRSLVDNVGVAIAEGKTSDEVMPLLERIRMVSQLVQDNVQDYALFEVNRTQDQYQAMQSSVARWGIACLTVFVAAALFSVIAAWSISKSIYVPIKKLHDVTTTIARHDLELLVTSENADEITELGMSFNMMVGKIRELLDAKLKEQENLKKAELRALQAQINPHFLYNTLDAIIWMAETKRTDHVVSLVRALSRFFRITLSKGKDWITIGDETDHIESYLAIQKLRYHDILDYSIDMPATVRDFRMLKLTLQPLVENALYHGIKNKRNGGKITVRGQLTASGRLQIDIFDNGIGIPRDKLIHLHDLLNGHEDEASDDGGYGITNVNQRLKLYYGPDAALNITSEYLQGTCVTLSIPLHNAFETNQNRPVASYG